jgi:tetratricopeptide (TPR) repeat protein
MRRLIWLTGIAILAACALARPSAAADDRETCYKAEGDVAIAACTRRIKSGQLSNSNLSIVYNNRGIEWKKKGDIERALADFNQAVRYDPTNPKSYFHRADILDDKGNVDAAIADYDQAIRIDPKYANAYFNRSIVKEKKGDMDGAFSDVAQYVALEPADPDGKRRIERLRGALATLPAPAQSQAAIAPKPEPILPPPVATDPGRRVALVIGNSAYTAVARLPNPQRDAETVAAALRRIGFQTVTVATDLSREKLINALIAFAREADNADWGLVYYAGHGIELGGVNYLIPVDARLVTDRDVELEAVPLSQVLGAVERAGKLRLVLLDACRDNPFASQMRRTIATRSVGRGLASIEPEAGTLVVYAAKHGETALDGDAGNSPFVTALVKNLAVPGVEIRRLFDLVRDDVMDLTKRRQQPFSYGSLPGRQDFFFVRK